MSKSSDNTFTTKLGTTRAGERTRIWIEGSRLLSHGFLPGLYFNKAWGNGELILTLAKDGKFKVSGKGEKPIIDISGATVAETFGKRSNVSVNYRIGKIIIKKGD